MLRPDGVPRPRGRCTPGGRCARAASRTGGSGRQERPGAGPSEPREPPCPSQVTEPRRHMDAGDVTCSRPSGRRPWFPGWRESSALTFGGRSVRHHHLDGRIASGTPMPRSLRSAVPTSTAPAPLLIETAHEAAEAVCGARHRRGCQPGFRRRRRRNRRRRARDRGIAVHRRVDALSRPGGRIHTRSRPRHDRVRRAGLAGGGRWPQGAVRSAAMVARRTVAGPAAVRWSARRLGAGRFAGRALVGSRGGRCRGRLRRRMQVACTPGGVSSVG